MFALWLGRSQRATGRYCGSWETRETGLEVEVVRLVGVFTREPNAGGGAHTMVAIVHLCQIVGGGLRLSHEGNDLRYWAIDEVPRWHATHEVYARALGFGRQRGCYLQFRMRMVTFPTL